MIVYLDWKIGPVRQAESWYPTVFLHGHICGSFWLCLKAPGNCGVWEGVYLTLHVMSAAIAATAFLHCYVQCLLPCRQPHFCLPGSCTNLKVNRCSIMTWLWFPLCTEYCVLRKDTNTFFSKTSLHPPGMSEKSKMHSLKPKDRSRSRSWYRMATPMHSGKEELPSSKVSHRWRILCIGNTSERGCYLCKNL